MHRTAAPPRGPRGGSARGGRGGIQKRNASGRPGPVRVDKDGDLVMDAGDKRSGRGQLDGSKSTRPATSTRVPTGPSRGGRAGMHRTERAITRSIGAKQVNILASLEVKGLSTSKAAGNADGGLESLLGFLERKATGHEASSNRTVRIKKSSKRGDLVIITASQEDCDAILKLDNFQFAGAVLSIKACDPPSGKRAESPAEIAQTVAEVSEKFREILAGRYDSNGKLLNLSSLGADPGLISMGLFEQGTTAAKVFPALMKICDKLFTTRQEKSDAISSVTLANNGLTDVSEVTTLAQSLPDLKHLDLSNNAISDIKGLQAWRFRFRQLETLLLSGNPIENQLDELKDELMRRYKNLRNLNGVQVRTPEEIEATRRTAKAPRTPVPIASADFRDIDHVGENFVRQFFQVYDTDRSALLETYYDDKSLFSLAVNTHSARNKEHSVPVAPWTDYLKQSRNLTRITHPGPRMNRQHQGKQAIRPIWTALPATQHPNILTQTNQYIIECYPQPGLPDPSGQNPGGVDGLYLCIHGEFEDKVSGVEKSMRSFTRTFILGPGGPRGPPIRVISDMLSLRAWSPLAQPQPPVIITPVATPPLLPTQPIVNLELQQQEAMAMQLTEQSGMTIQYSGLCLSETGWDLERAWVVFNENKHNLPAEAFLSGVVPVA